MPVWKHAGLACEKIISDPQHGFEHDNHYALQFGLDKLNGLLVAAVPAGGQHLGLGVGGAVSRVVITSVRFALVSFFPAELYSTVILLHKLGFINKTEHSYVWNNLQAQRYEITCNRLSKDRYFGLKTTFPSFSQNHSLVHSCDTPIFLCNYWSFFAFRKYFQISISIFLSSFFIFLQKYPSFNKIFHPKWYL